MAALTAALRAGGVTVGAAQPIADTLFTLVSIASALFMLAGAAVLGARAPRLARLATWAAPLMLAMYARYGLDATVRVLGPSLGAGAVRAVGEALFTGVPLLGAAVLALLASRDWTELRRGMTPVTAVPNEG